MTINKEFDEITFWEPSVPKKIDLKGRIEASEISKL